MLPEDKYYERLAIETSMILDAEPNFSPLDGDISRWKGFLVGQGLWQGNNYWIEIIIPREFPYHPPLVRWETPIIHPNIKGEEVCMNVLSEAWAPNMNVINVIEGLKMMFTGYNLESPLDEAGVEWVKVRLQGMEKAT